MVAVLLQGGVVQLRNAETGAVRYSLTLLPPASPGGRSTTCLAWSTDSAHLALLVDDLAALYERLRAAGVECVSEPVRIDAGPNTGAWALYLRDPNGILIELFQPPPQAIP